LALKVGLTLAVAAALLPRADVDHTQSGLPELIWEFLNETNPPILDDASLHGWAAAVRTAAGAATSEETLWAELKDLEEVGDLSTALGRIREQILIWYDYSSMFQAPRTTEEEAQFQRELLELNAIQAHAATLVIAGDEDYLSRAWCFLELCGGMRHDIVELVPSWGQSVRISQATPRWAPRSDQLIGALNIFGLDAIKQAGLQAAHEEDLLAIAELLSQLPLIGLVETDDSDLVGGVIPLPRRDSEWISVREAKEPARTISMPAVYSFGTLPQPPVLAASAQSYAEADKLSGSVGIWVYTTQRVLSLAWAARATDIWTTLNQQLKEHKIRLAGMSTRPGDASVACMWADARALADDGQGWTRIVPSTPGLLVVLTQADLPPICRIYDRVVGSHLAGGIPVITFSPDSGHATVHVPSGIGPPPEASFPADVVAVPRIRRSEAYPRKLLISPHTEIATLELQAALRLEPGQASPAPGRVSQACADAELGVAGAEIPAIEMMSFSQRRVYVEALARCVAATWEEWFEPRLDASAWTVGMAPSQLAVIEGLIHAVHAGFENPFQRRQLLRVLLSEHDGYALPPWLVDDAAELIARLGD
jgi:hypothetical protein